MHSIKSKARRAAWRTDPDDQNNVVLRVMPYAGRHSTNPGSPLPFFPSRRATKASHPDPDEAVENGDEPLRHAHSEGCVISDREGLRTNNEHGYSDSGVARSSTLPPVSPVFHNSTNTHIPPTENKYASPQSTSTGETLTPNKSSGSGSASENGGPRRRHHIPFTQSKEKEQNGFDSERQDTSERPKQKLTFASQMKATIGSWVNILLICVPLGIALNYALDDQRTHRIIVFVINFLAIVPLAGILSYATEELAMRVGETLGGLLNASFGNAVELIVAIIALAKDEILIVQTSLIGSMLSNLLLVMGMCFFAGGINRIEQNFNVTVAQTACSLLMLSVAALIIPTAFQNWSSADNAITLSKIPALSRGVSIILLFVYACYLFFQLHTHKDVYNAPSEKVPKKKSKKVKEGDASKGIAQIGAGTAAGTGGGAAGEVLPKMEEANADDDEEETPKLTVVWAVAALCISTALVGVCSEYLVDSISAVTAGGAVSTEFVGLILLPIVGNAAEHVTALTVAIKDKMDLAIGVAIGSSLQIALLVLPLSVILGWIIGGAEPMTLNFDLFLIWLLFVAVLLVNYLIADGKSHWLEGILLMVTYVIIAVSAWFYPATGNVAG
ncbi:MAG: hypothetical protein M1828_004260 [Chrysothrix sp. TS-e1954]|nr:MAG: hypothetical protein M1828_004260 [Chrysothrix sp. TS-e1954]